MCTILNENELWDKVISYTESNPLDFETLESHYEIGKLELGKFISIEVRAKQKEFQLRYWKESEETSKTWMENEYRLFMWFLLAYFKMIERKPENFESEDWELVAKAFKKQPNVCKYFYLCTIKTTKQVWNQEEDDIVQTLMKSNISKKWTDIGLELFQLSNGKSFRKPKAIRERWLSHLNPSIKKETYIYTRAEWSLEEELDLIEKIKEYGKKWSKIAKILGNRSEHIVKNRFNKIKQKYEKEIEKWNKKSKLSESEFIEFLESEFEKKLLLKDEKQENERKLLNGSEETIFISTEEIKLETEHTEVNFHQAQIFEPIILIFPCLSL